MLQVQLPGRPVICQSQASSLSSLAHPVPLCTPVIHYFREQDVQTLSHAPYPLKRITLTRNQFQLHNDRLIACACSSFDEEQQGLNSTSTRPQWLGVSAGAQTFSWAFPDSWKRGRVAVKQVSYLTDFRFWSLCLWSFGRQGRPASR